MAWTSLTFSFGSTLTSAKMTQLYDNFQALADKASGAPTLANDYIVNAMVNTDAVNQDSIAASAVGQGELKVSTETDSNSTGNHVTITVANAEYAFSAMYKNSYGSSVRALKVVTSMDNESVVEYSDSTSYLRSLILVAASGVGTAYHRVRYVTASPPYDLGDGEIPLFIFALMDKSGNVVAMQVCQEPPWAHNGPTTIKPDFYDRRGVGHQLQIMVPDDPNDINGMISALDNPEYRVVEIDQSVKNADMDLIPHPFLDNDLNMYTPVLLDPVSPITEKLALMYENDIDVNEVIHRGYITVGNTHLQRKGPRGLLIPSIKWRQVA